MYTADGNVKLYNHSGMFSRVPDYSMAVLKKLSIHLPGNPAIILLGIYPREMKTMGYFYTSVAVMVHESTQVTKKNSIELDTHTVPVGLLGLILD